MPILNFFKLHDWVEFELIIKLRIKNRTRYNSCAIECFVFEIGLKRRHSYVFALCHPFITAVKMLRTLLPKTSFTKPSLAKLTCFRLAPEEIRDFHVAHLRSSSCPPMLIALPSRTSHSALSASQT